MAWMSLVLAGFFETFAVWMINRLSVKKNVQTVCLIILGLGSALSLLSYALQSIPMGTGYAIWTGISVVGSSIIGMIFFNEAKDAWRLFFIGLILFSAIGLKLFA